MARSGSTAAHAPLPISLAPMLVLCVPHSEVHVPHLFPSPQPSDKRTQKKNQEICHLLWDRSSRVTVEHAPSAWMSAPEALLAAVSVAQLPPARPCGGGKGRRSGKSASRELSSVSTGSEAGSASAAPTSTLCPGCAQANRELEEMTTGNFEFLPLQPACFSSLFRTIKLFSMHCPGSMAVITGREKVVYAYSLLPVAVTGNNTGSKPRCYSSERPARLRDLAALRGPPGPPSALRGGPEPGAQSNLEHVSRGNALGPGDYTWTCM